MKVSEIQINNIAEYLKLDFDEYSEKEIKVLLDAAKAYIRSYTGLTDTEIDKHEDIVIVVYVLCQDMHDTRTLYVDKNYMNKVVETTLGMYCTNLLPTPN